MIRRRIESRISGRPLGSARLGGNQFPPSANSDSDAQLRAIGLAVAALRVGLLDLATEVEQIQRDLRRAA
jgi:hypothetical protein